MCKSYISADSNCGAQADCLPAGGIIHSQWLVQTAGTRACVSEQCLKILCADHSHINVQLLQKMIKLDLRSQRVKRHSWRILWASNNFGTLRQCSESHEKDLESMHWGATQMENQVEVGHQTFVLIRCGIMRMSHLSRPGMLDWGAMFGRDGNELASLILYMSWSSVSCTSTNNLIQEWSKP